MKLLPRDKHVMPWHIEDELKRFGANYVQAGMWRGFAIRDGNLITGQQNFPGRRDGGAPGPDARDLSDPRARW